MEKILHYIDIPEERRLEVLRSLQDIGFWTNDGLETLKAQMDASSRDGLPVYRFVFRGDALIGYSFLYGASEPNQIGGGGQNNVDTLPLALAVRILEEDIAILEANGCIPLAKMYRMLLENQRKGTGRRKEADCR